MESIRRGRKSEQIKVLVVGDAYSGKTALLKSICKVPFVTNYSPTICESLITNIKVGKKDIEFNLWDTAGDEFHDRFGNLFYAGSDVVLACFAIDNPASVVAIAERWVPKVRHHCPSTPIILVGCKSDLRKHSNESSDTTVTSEGDSGDNTAEETKCQLLNREEGSAMATRIGAYLYLETSAKTKYGVEALVTLTGKAALEKKSSVCRIL